MAAIKETVVPEICNGCGSKRFIILHHLQFNRHDRLFLECADCGHFQSRIIVHAYVRSDRLYSGAVAELREQGDDLTREQIEAMMKHTRNAQEQYQHIKEIIHETMGKDIQDDIRKYYQEYKIREDG